MSRRTSTLQHRVRAVLCASMLGFGCYGGEGTLGGACERADDCGDAQTCERQVCSLCDDGIAQAGELCLADPELVGPRGASSQAPRLIDLDADGREELLWIVEGGIAIATASTDGFSEATVMPFDATALWVGDALGDGVVEVLVRDAAGGASLWSPRVDEPWTRLDIELEALRGLADAAIDAQLGIAAIVQGEVVHVPDPQGDATVFALPFPPSRLAGFADLDGDGTREVVAVLEDEGVAWVDVTRPDAEAGALAVPAGVRDVVLVAFNSDAAADLVVLDGDGRATLWLGGPQGSPIEAASAQFTLSTAALAVADVTFDGQLDLLGYGQSSDGVRLAIRRGATFDRPAIVVEGPWVWVRPSAVGVDPFADLLLFDGETFSFAARTP